MLYHSASRSLTRLLCIYGFLFVCSHIFALVYDSSLSSWKIRWRLLDSNAYYYHIFPIPTTRTHTETCIYTVCTPSTYHMYGLKFHAQIRTQTVATICCVWRLCFHPSSIMLDFHLYVDVFKCSCALPFIWSPPS